MAQELAPRFQLVTTIRTIFIFFGIFALINGHTYIGTLYNWEARAAFTISWIAIAWNIVYVAAVTIHPHLQRFADRLPFPISVTVRGKTILSYGDSEDEHGSTFAGLITRMSTLVFDLVLATLILVFLLLSRGKQVDCWSCDGKYYRMEKWMINVWWTMLGFQYLFAFIEALDAAGFWYKRRHLNKRGQISLA